MCCAGSSCSRYSTRTLYTLISNYRVSLLCTHRNAIHTHTHVPFTGPRYIYIYIYNISAPLIQGGPPGHVGSEEAN